MLRFRLTAATAVASAVLLAAGGGAALALGGSGSSGSGGTRGGGGRSGAGGGGTTPPPASAPTLNITPNPVTFPPTPSAQRIARATGAAITDAQGSTAYVCNGADGANGQSFSGTFTSPSGQFSIAVGDSGITLAGPGNNIKLDATGQISVITDTHLQMVAGSAAALTLGGRSASTLGGRSASRHQRTACSRPPGLSPSRGR